VVLWPEVPRISKFVVSPRKISQSQLLTHQAFTIFRGRFFKLARRRRLVERTRPGYNRAIDFVPTEHLATSELRNGPPLPFEHWITGRSS
jgi:hypothetical protein